MTQLTQELFSTIDWQGKIYTGRWSNSLGGQHQVVEPATGQALATVGMANAEDVAISAAAAKTAQKEWAKQAPQERAAVLRRAADLFARYKDEIALWLVREAGGTRPKAQFEVQQTINFTLEAAAIASQPPGLVLPSAFPRISLATRVPRGVIGIISPFNFPLLLSMRATAPALSLGNAVLLKPDLRTAVAGGLVVARVFEEAGLPAGVLHVLPGGGEAGQALGQDPNIAMISFTGSTETGRKVAELAGKHLKKVTLELGGKNSILILDDADLDLAASNVAWGAWLHQGQICMSAGRVLVHEKLVNELLERLVEKADHLPVGNPYTEEVAFGPLIDERQLGRVDAIVQDSIKQGAELKAGGTHTQLFYSPTVIAKVTPRMRAFREEIFGPVAAITTFSQDEEAIALASDTEYGLSAGVISGSVERALAVARQLPVGMTHVNDQSVDDESVVPFGGIGASGNGTRHGGPSNWDEFTEWRWMTIQDKPHAAGFSGLATGFITLYLMRLLMGVFEGAYTPVSIAATTEASRPERRGLNIGIQLGCFALIGLGFGPIILTQLLGWIHSWRGVFAIVAIPGLIVAYLMYRTIREPSHLWADRPTDAPATRYPWSAIFQHRNVVVGTLRWSERCPVYL